MATFHCYAEVEDVRGIIERFCNEHDTQLRRVSNDAYRCLITGHWHSPDMEIGVNGDRPPVTVTLSITMSKQARSTVFGLLVPGCGCTALGIAWLGASIWLAPAGLAIGALFLTIALRLIDSTHRRAYKAASILTDALKSSTRVVQVSPLRLLVSYAPRRATAFVIAMVASLVLSCFVTFGFVFGAVVLIGLGGEIAYAVLAHRSERSWRGAFAGLQTTWSLPSWGALLMTVSIAVVSVVEHGIATGALEYSGAPAVFLDEETQAVLADWSFADESPNDFAIEILAAIEAREIQSGIPREDRFPTKYIPTIVGLLLLECSTFALLAAFQFVTARNNWRFSVSNPSADRAVPPVPDARRGPMLDAALIVVFAVLTGLLHWMCAIIAIDAVSLTIAGQCLIWERLGWMLALFTLNVRLLTGSTDSWAWIVSAACLLPVALPGLAGICVACHRIAGMMIIEITRLRGALPRCHEGMAYLLNFVDRTSIECGIRIPSVYLISDPRPYIQSEARVIGSRGRIILSSACQSLLEHDELKALAAHEIHHLRRDARMVKYLKLFSIALLSPLNLLVMLFDFERSEREADLFAASTMNGSRSLRSALVKLAAANLASGVAANTSNTSDHVAKGRSPSKPRGRGVLSLFLDDSLLGAAYPTLSERIAWLQTIDPFCGSEQSDDD